MIVYFRETLTIISIMTTKKRIQTYKNQLIIGTLLILIPIVVIAEIFMPNIVAVFAGNIQDQYSFSLFVKAARIMFPYILFIGVSSIFIGILNTYGRFALSAGLPFIINISAF